MKANGLTTEEACLGGIRMNDFLPVRKMKKIGRFVTTNQNKVYKLLENTFICDGKSKFFLIVGLSGLCYAKSHS